MKNALKFSHDEDDNIETVKGLDAAIKEWLETIGHPWDGYTRDLENFEFRRRDGFIPHSHNRGGVDLFTVSNVASLHGSGEHYDLSIRDWVDKSWDETSKEIAEEHPEMDQDSDEFFELVYESCSQDYNAVAWRVRVMYEGNGVLRIYAGYDLDAPYFRWQGATKFETEINFKTISGLKRQLKSITKKIEESQND